MNGAEPSSTFTFYYYREIPGSQLVSAINTDYTQFVTLSAQLEGLESTLMRLKRPLNDAGDRLQDVAASLVARRREVSNTQSVATLLDSRASALQTYLTARELYADVVAGTERLSQHAGSHISSTAAATLHGLALQSRRCRDYLLEAKSALNTQLPASAAVKSGEDGRLRESIGAMASNCDAAEAALAPLLVSALQNSLASVVSDASASAKSDGAVDAADPADYLHLLFTALAALGRQADAADAVTASVSRPLFAGLFTQGRVDDGARGSFKAFSRVCDEALAGITQPGGALATVLDAAACVPGLDLFSHCLWAPLVAVLGSQLPAYANPAQPAVFQANYTALSTLIVRLRTLAAGHTLLLPQGGPGELVGVPASEALQASATTAALRASLAPKLQVYHALRTADATSRLDKGCAARMGALDLGVGFGPPAPVTAAPGGAPQASSPVAPAPAQTGPASALTLSDLTSGIPAAYLRAGSERDPPPPAAQLLLPASAALWSALSSLWSPSVFIPALGTQTLTATLACVSRYGGWGTAGAALGAGRFGAPSVISALNGERTSSGGELALLPLPASWASSLTLPLPAPPAVAGAPSAAGSAGGAPAAPALVAGSPWPGSSAVAAPDGLAWGDATVDAHLAAAADAGILAMLVARALLPRVMASLALPPPPATEDAAAAASSAQGGASAATSAAVVSLLSSASSQLRALQAYHLAVVRAALGRACCAPLASLRAVPATFRMTAKGAPSKPSPYAASVLKPLRVALAAAAPSGRPWSLAGIPPAQLSALALGVCGEAGASLDATLASVLESLARMEESLAWLKKGPAAQQAPGAAVSDSDKIGLQLHLDVRAMARDAADVLASAGDGSAAAAGLPPAFDAAAARVAQYAPLVAQ